MKKLTRPPQEFGRRVKWSLALCTLVLLGLAAPSTSWAQSSGEEESDEPEDE